jgi:protein gp37
MSTGIQWTDETWNPTVGCDRISPGCAHCYAKDLHDKRHKAHLAGKAMAPQYAQPFETLQMIASRLDAPLHWRKPRKVFVNSVSDLFHEAVPDAFIDQVFAVMALAPQHTFQILTKRAERMRDYLSADVWRERVELALWDMHTDETTNALPLSAPPLKNVWLGVSVENQHFADERIPLLLQTPAAVRFISAEPLLGPLDLNAVSCLAQHRPKVFCGEPWMSGPVGCTLSALHPGHHHAGGTEWGEHGAIIWPRTNDRLDWVIVGGESGKGARPCATEWIGSLVAQCQAAAVPVFVKQLGAYVVSEERTASLDHFSDPSSPKLLLAPNGEAWAWRAGLRDSHGGDPAEWPEDLRVRQFPASALAQAASEA